MSVPLCVDTNSPRDGVGSYGSFREVGCSLLVAWSIETKGSKLDSGTSVPTILSLLSSDGGETGE